MHLGRVNIYLTPTENQTLTLLSLEKSYFVVKREAKQAHYLFHLYLSKIRQKTGIADLRDSAAILAYMERVKHALSLPIEPHAQQIIARVLGIAYGEHTFEALENNMKLEKGTGAQAWQSAIQSIGIFSTHLPTQKAQARLYCATRLTIVRPSQPVTPKEWTILRMYVRGDYYQDIADIEGYSSEKWVKVAIKDAAHKLGINTPGRGARIPLIRAAIARHDAENTPQNSDPMDDPAF